MMLVSSLVSYPVTYQVPGQWYVKMGHINRKCNRTQKILETKCEYVVKIQISPLWEV